MKKSLKTTRLGKFVIYLREGKSLTEEERLELASYLDWFEKEIQRKNQKIEQIKEIMRK